MVGPSITSSSQHNMEICQFSQLDSQKKKLLYRNSGPFLARVDDKFIPWCWAATQENVKADVTTAYY